MKLLVNIIVGTMTMTMYSSSIAYAYQGIATFYTPPYIPSACKGKEKHENLIIAAAGDGKWENKAACGRSYLVKCIGPTNKTPEACKEGEVVVKIVDRCENCHATINLSQESFANIANLDAGTVLIQYQLF